jgi:hypothetical protein
MESDGHLRAAVNSVGVRLVMVMIAALVLVYASAGVSAPNARAGGGHHRGSIFQKGHVLGAPGSTVSFLVVRRGSNLRWAWNGDVREVPTSCINPDTGEERNSSLVDAFFLEDHRIVQKRFHVSKSNAVFWHGPGGFDEAGEFEVSGRLKRKGTRGQGTFAASATVNRKWECSTGRVRWHTRAPFE